MKKVRDVVKSYKKNSSYKDFYGQVY